MQNRIMLDLHTHTLASGHAYGTVRENALAASEKGIVGMGVTEHGPGMPGSCHPLYFTNIDYIPRNLYGVNIYYGVENDMMPDGTMSLDDRWMFKLDYAIVGIHATCYRDQGIEKNTENLIKCMSNPKVFFVSHPDDSTYPLDYEQVVPAAKQYGVALEVNNNTVRSARKKNWRENIMTYLDLCMRYRTSIVVDSDAHDPSTVGRFMEAEALLDGFGFDEDLIVNTSEEKFRSFIGFAK